MSLIKLTVRIIALSTLCFGLGLLSCSDNLAKENAITGIAGKNKAAIDFGQCAPCFERFCVRVCPQRAIDSIPAIREEKEIMTFIIDPDKCIRCGYCFDVCPLGAIYWKR